MFHDIFFFFFLKILKINHNISAVKITATKGINIASREKIKDSKVSTELMKGFANPPVVAVDVARVTVVEP